MRSSVQHFEDITEVELAPIMELDVGKDLLDLAFGKVSFADVICAHQFLLADEPVVGVIDHFECLEVHSLAPVGNNLGGH